MSSGFRASVLAAAALSLALVACDREERHGRAKPLGENVPAGPSPGVLHAEKLVNMSKHQYHLEPNVSFTPDQKWVVFRSNMFGGTQVYAVELAKAQ